MRIVQLGHSGNCQPASILAWFVLCEQSRRQCPTGCWLTTICLLPEMHSGLNQHKQLRENQDHTFICQNPAQVLGQLGTSDLGKTRIPGPYRLSTYQSQQQSTLSTVIHCIGSTTRQDSFESQAQAGNNRPRSLRLLEDLQELQKRICRTGEQKAGRDPRVADIGCGLGAHWS